MPRVGTNVHQLVVHDRRRLVTFDVKRSLTVETDLPAETSLEVTEDGEGVTEEAVKVIQTF